VDHAGKGPHPAEKAENCVALKGPVFSLGEAMFSEKEHTLGGLQSLDRGCYTLPSIAVKEKEGEDFRGGEGASIKSHVADLLVSPVFERNNINLPKKGCRKRKKVYDEISQPQFKASRKKHHLRRGEFEDIRPTNGPIARRRLTKKGVEGPPHELL